MTRYITLELKPDGDVGLQTQDSYGYAITGEQGAYRVRFQYPALDQAISAYVKEVDFLAADGKLYTYSSQNTGQGTVFEKDGYFCCDLGYEVTRKGLLQIVCKARQSKDNGPETVIKWKPYYLEIEYAADVNAANFPEYRSEIEKVKSLYGESVKFKGRYQNTLAYISKDMVEHDGQMFLCLADCVGQTPQNGSLADTYWMNLSFQADKLKRAVGINGIPFDGTKDIQITLEGELGFANTHTQVLEISKSQWQQDAALGVYVLPLVPKQLASFFEDERYLAHEFGVSKNFTVQLAAVYDAESDMETVVPLQCYFNAIHNDEEEWEWDSEEPNPIDYGVICYVAAPAALSGKLILQGV